MRRYRVLVSGLLMVGAGAFLMFSSPDALPLWFIWIAGPLLWYIGIAISIGGAAFALFLPLSAHVEKQVLTKKQKRAVEVPVLKMQKFDCGLAPAGLAREIPAMGGFIL